MSDSFMISITDEYKQELNEFIRKQSEELKKEILTQKRELSTKRWYSPQESCVYLGISSTTTLRKYARSAGIKPKRLSKKMVRYDVMDLNKIFLEDRLSTEIRKQKK